MISSIGVMFFDDPVAAFTNIAAALRRRGRLAFPCWQSDTHNEVFTIPLQAFGAHVRLPGPAVGDLFVSPQQIGELLSGTGWRDIQVGAISNSTLRVSAPTECGSALPPGSSPPAAPERVIRSRKNLPAEPGA